jgi:energy-coupling factor transporter ATP-binding protein EcfA2
MYAQSLEECVNLIVHGTGTVMAQGHIGVGKSTMLPMVGKILPNHTLCYFDCNTKCDAGDIGLPQFHLIDEQGCVTYVPNEEIGIHLDGPIILMIDEYGKAVKPVKNAMLRLVHERKYGNKQLHPDSKVFLTTNLGAEGVGDILLPHEVNRMTVIPIRKSTNLEYIEYGLNAGVHHTILGWCKETPQLFQSFEDVEDPSDNPYIFHPRQQREAFVTNRSLSKASDWLKVRDAGHINDHSLTATLIGTMGDRAALDCMAFVSLAGQLPSQDSIKETPETAMVPTSAAAVCLVVFRTLGNIDKSWVDAWMTYFLRLDTEAQGMFVNGVRAESYGKEKQAVIMSNRKFTEWCMHNTHLYSADKV